MWYEMKIHLRVLPTCVNPLPAHSEGSPGLDEVIGDGAAVVSAGAPGQLGCTVCHLLHRHRVWRAGGAWLNHRNRRCEVLAHAEAQTRLQNVDVNVCAPTNCKRKHELQIYLHKKHIRLNYIATRDYRG